jgi:hypothetical protein
MLNFLKGFVFINYDKLKFWLHGDSFYINVVVELNELLIGLLLFFLKKIKDVWKMFIVGLILWLSDMRKRFSLIDEVVLRKGFI